MPKMIPTVLPALRYELEAPRSLVVREEHLDLSRLPVDAVAARTLASVISPGTEVAAYVGAPPLRPGMAYPRLVGYCNVAEVVAVGEAVTGVSVGERVLTWQSHRSAFICPPSNILARVGTGIDPSVAATTYLFFIGHHALRRGEAFAGANVAIIGLGTLGLATAAMAVDAGCRVVGFSNRMSVRETAVAFGCDRIIVKDAVEASNELINPSNGARIDLVVTTSDRWEDWLLAMKIAGRGGTVVAIGFPGRGQEPPRFNPLDSQYFYDKELTLKAAGEPVDANAADEGQLALRRDCAIIVQRIAEGRLPARRLISEIISWRNLKDAYERLARRESGLLTIALTWQ